MGDEALYNGPQVGKSNRGQSKGGQNKWRACIFCSVTGNSSQQRNMQIAFSVVRLLVGNSSLKSKRNGLLSPVCGVKERLLAARPPVSRATSCWAVSRQPLDKPLPPKHGTRQGYPQLSFTILANLSQIQLLFCPPPS